MKGVIPGFLAVCCAVPALAAEPAPACLDPHRIAGTVVLDDSTILFRMEDGKTWKNNLQKRCSGLLAEGGFSYDAAGDAVCAGKQVIRVLRRGTACVLGAFEPYVSAPRTP
jgi:hypothetical protein